MRISVLLIIVLIDALVMVLYMFIPMSNYNWATLSLYALLLLVLPYKKNNLILFAILSFYFFTIVSSHRLHCIFDTFTVIDTIGLVILFGEYSIKKRDKNLIQNILLTFYTINLIMSLFPSNYGGGEIRFMGIFDSCNLSVSIMTICGVAIWEIEKNIRNHPRKFILLLNLIGFVILIFATRTRTVLFLFPYWLYQCYNSLNKKLFITSIIIGVALFSSSIFQSLNERMNLEGDSSSTTRGFIYLSLISEILNNYFIIPHGVHESYYYVIHLTGNPNFSPHNDFLRYIFDWGGYFFIFIIYLVTQLKKYIRFDMSLWLVLVGYSALSLHNMLFLPIVWIPLCIIFNMHRKRITRSSKSLLPKIFNSTKSIMSHSL